LCYNMCKCFQIKRTIENKFFVIAQLDFPINKSHDGLKKDVQRTWVFSHGSYVLMMLIGASISQSCALNRCLFYKLHGLICIPFAICWDGKLCFMHFCVDFFLNDEVGNAHMLLSLKVLSSNRCAWSFYVVVWQFL